MNEQHVRSIVGEEMRRLNRFIRAAAALEAGIHRDVLDDIDSSLQSAFTEPPACTTSSPSSPASIALSSTSSPAGASGATTGSENDEVERVAEAIFDEVNPSISWDERISQRGYYLNLARAAMAAMKNHPNA